MPKKNILEICEKAIRKDLGKLDDLPYELANTISNVYYRYFEMAFNFMQPDHEEFAKAPNIFQAQVALTKKLAKIKSDFNAVTGFVEDFREIDKYEDPNSYQMALDFILDCLKYDLKDPHKKTGIRRMIERKIRKSRVQEIENLIDLLHI